MRAMLTTRVLRTLTIDPLCHPRGQAHLSAASGLVCANGLVYVVADDEHHLGVFRDRETPGELHRLFAGDLPGPKAKRKRRKADLETLLLWPAFGPARSAALLALGSGSRANRCGAAVVPLNERGEPGAVVLRFDLEPLYAPLRERLGEINIEGAMLIGDEFVLLNRGVAGRSDNAVARYPLRALSDAVEGRRADLKPPAILRYPLGAIDAVPLGFTDAAALPDGDWVFTAVAENTADSYTDGHCHGSVVGVVDAAGAVVAIHRLDRPLKVEGIAVRADGTGLTVCMVTDADDPAQGSQLLLAQL